VKGFTVAVALSLGLVVGPSASAAPTAAPTTVSDAIVGFTFVVGYASLSAPEQTLRIRPGDTVEWTNLDPISHSISFDALPGKGLYLKQPGDKGAVTFDQAGYYIYRCAEHPEFPGMEGLVFVAD
jgi:plastocyanin